jgi:hypothetical protein
MIVKSKDEDKSNFFFHKNWVKDILKSREKTQAENIVLVTKFAEIKMHPPEFSKKEMEIRGGAN